MSVYDYTIIGGGIIGLSTAMALGKHFPEAQILVLEKEKNWAFHQTGHNSGVIHSGIYYKPGSLKARLGREGNRSMVEFCQEHGIEHEVCGKVIVATASGELPLLENLYQRGLTNGLRVRKIGPEELREIEPHVNGLAGIHVPSTGIVNFKQVAETFAYLIRAQGGTFQLNTRAEKIIENGQNVVVESTQGTFRTRFLINCAGLHSDRIARLGQAKTNMKIVPFRGEYYDLKPEKRYLVKNLIYPVPNPNFPFLGVHFTRMIDGGVHAGPNAVLSFKREGYKKSDFDLRDFIEVMSYLAFWKLARQNWREGTKEIIRSVSKTAFVHSMQQLIPEIQADDITPGHAGVRAQALMDDGRLMDDFVIIPGHRSIHVCNAPSPAATASIEIGKAVVAQIPEQQDLLKTGS
jgi:L-2-hydroxyglutarate oxidase